MEWMQVRNLGFRKARGVGQAGGAMERSQQRDRVPFQLISTETREFMIAQGYRLPSRCAGIYCPIALASVFWEGILEASTGKLSHRWVEVDCSLCCCPVGSLVLSVGCCSLKASTAWRRGQPRQPHGMTASSATRPMISPHTCLAASTVATPSARHVCGDWILQPTNNTGYPAHSAVKVPLFPVEG